MPWRIVVDSNAQEQIRYPTTFPEQFTDQFPLDQYQHLLVENMVDPDSVMPQKAEDSTVTLVPNLEWYWSQLRAERNRRLAACDWTRLDDVQVNKESWAEYRQALRNLPGNTTDPTNVTWPVAPSS